MRAGFHRVHRDVLAGAARNQDERQVEFFVLQQLQRRKRAETRHCVARNDQVPGLSRKRRFHRLERFNALVGWVDACAAQRQHHQLGVIRRVVDYQ
jgi:membrane-bound lytic murein transglycosylase